MHEFSGTQHLLSCEAFAGRDPLNAEFGMEREKGLTKINVNCRLILRLLQSGAIGRNRAVSRNERPLRAIIAAWWTRRRGQPTDLERTADQLGMAPDQLRDIADRAYLTTNLMPLRMTLLQLDPDELAHSDPKRYRELEACCKLCEDKARCTWDIAHDAADPRWQEYCPNAAKFRAMQAGNPPNPKPQ